MNHDYDVPFDSIAAKVRQLQCEIAALSKEVSINRALVLLLAKSLQIPNESIEKLERQAEKVYLIGLQKYAHEKSKQT